jgi:tripartite-type tricarboxylate transporter receptor subunit TctC
MVRNRIPAAALASVLAFTSPLAAAQNYPVKPIRMVIPYSAGGGVDVIGRFIGARLSEQFGQQVIPDNRGGGGGTVGTDIVAKAPTDGYTVLVTNNGLVFSESLYSKLPYDTIKDLAAVSLLGTTPSVLVVHPSLPAKTVRELVALMKAKPAQLNYGSGGVGGAVHLAFALFENVAGVKGTHVPYKGVGPALIDTVGGQVHMMMAGAPAALGHIKGNRLRALGVSGMRRAQVLAEVPTIAEAGVPGYEYTTWYGMLVPAASPKSIVASLNQNAVKALSNADLRDKLAQQGVEAETSTPEEFAARVKREVATWAKTIKAAGIHAE